MVQQLKIFNTHCLQTNLSDGYLCTVDPIVSLNLSPNKQETGLGDSEDKKEKINRKWHIWKYLYSYNGATVGFFFVVKPQPSSVWLSTWHIAQSNIWRIKYTLRISLVFEVRWIIVLVQLKSNFEKGIENYWSKGKHKRVIPVISRNRVQQSDSGSKNPIHFLHKRNYF